MYPLFVDSGDLIGVDYGPVVFTSHTGEVFHVQIGVSLMCVLGYYFYIYCALFSCFLLDLHKEGVLFPQFGVCFKFVTHYFRFSPIS